MAPFLIILALLALGVGIVVWAVRRHPAPATPAAASPLDGPQEQDTAWNDPVSPAGSGEPSQPEAPLIDPFAHAPTPDPAPGEDERP